MIAPDTEVFRVALEVRRLSEWPNLISNKASLVIVRTTYILMPQTVDSKVAKVNTVRYHVPILCLVMCH